MKSMGTQPGARGFTLVESSIAVLLMGIIFLVTVSIFIMMTKEAVMTQSQIAASLDASRATQAIIADARESAVIALPNESNFMAPTGYSASNFTTTYNGNTVCAALCLFQPMTGSTLTFPGCANSVTLYNRNVQLPNTYGAYKVYYRADSNGTPDPSAGNYLWLWVSDGSVNAPVIRIVDSGIASSPPNAVEFERPAASIANTEVSVKIVSTYYTPIDSASSQTQNGHYTTALTGTCVRMRDYSSSTSSSPAVTGAHWAGF